MCLLISGLLLTVDCRSRNWLAGFLLFLACYLGLIILDAQSFYISPSLYFLCLTIIFLPGPILLGYVSHISSQSHVSWLDFVPASLPVIVVVTCAPLLGDHWLAEADEQAYQAPVYLGLFNLISTMAGLLMASYVLSAVRLLLKLKANWASYQSQTLPRSWHKMVHVMVVTLLVTFVQLLSAFGHPSGDRVSMGDIAFIIYVGYFIVLAVQTTLDKRAQVNTDETMLESHYTNTLPEVSAVSLPAPEEMQQQCAQIKEQVLTQALHLQSDLTLGALAQALDTTSHKLSIAINTGLGVTFYEFINDLRCRYAAQALIESPEKAITDILYEAGFTAKSTFYHHFKKAYGKTPSQYRKQNLDGQI